MIVGIKRSIGYILFKVIGTASFVRRIEWRKIFQWLDPGKSERILDVACGVGQLSLKIAGRGCEVYGIDMSEDAIDYARYLSKRVKIVCQFQVGNAEHLPYPDGYFDKIVCSSSLEHFHDDGKALTEMRRVLKQNGSVVLTVDSLTFPISKTLKDKHKKMAAVVHYYTRDMLRENLYHAGLEMYRSEYLLKSRLTSIFFKLNIRFKLPAVFWLLVAFAGYPFFLVSEKLSSRHDCGYTLLAEARKAN